jgi:molybdopterin/thiamine biosynthesis adenylyltransferase
MQDVGKPKSEVAAVRVMQRVKGVTVIPHFCKIEDKDIAFYKDFQIIVLGLDQLCYLWFCWYGLNASIHVWVPGFTVFMTG